MLDIETPLTLLISVFATPIIFAIPPLGVGKIKTSPSIIPSIYSMRVKGGGGSPPGGSPPGGSPPGGSPPVGEYALKSILVKGIETEVFWTVEIEGIGGF